MKMLKGFMRMTFNFTLVRERSRRLPGRGGHHAKFWTKYEYELYRHMREKGMGILYAQNSLYKSSECQQYYMSFIL